MKARGLIGRWLSPKKGIGATPEILLLAIRAAAAIETPGPIAYIEAAARKETSSARRDGDEWLIPHGTEEYLAHRKVALIANSSAVYSFPDMPGHVARAKTRWPQRSEHAA